MRSTMYEQIADYYDLTHADLSADIPFVRALAKAAQGPVLELGCGSGRLLLPLAQAGIPVTGLDNSPAMLKRARARLQSASAAARQQVTLHKGDMTAFQLDHYFALILIPYNTFLHCDSKQATAVLQCIQAHLQEDGRLFIDLANPFALANTPEDHLLSLEGSYRDPQTGDHILQFGANRLDTVAQTLHTTWMYDRSAAGGGPVQRTVAEAVYHYRYPHQWELLLHEIGFKQITFLGDYNESAFSEESDRLLVLAQ